jgi:hypothetical protein
MLASLLLYAWFFPCSCIYIESMYACFLLYASLLLYIESMYACFLLHIRRGYVSFLLYIHREWPLRGNAEVCFLASYCIYVEDMFPFCCIYRKSMLAFCCIYIESMLACCCIYRENMFLPLLFYIYIKGMLASLLLCIHREYVCFLLYAWFLPVVYTIHRGYVSLLVASTRQRRSIYT